MRCCVWYIYWPRLKAASVVKLPFRTPRAPVEHFCPPDLVPHDITACLFISSNITPVTLKVTNRFAPGQTYRLWWLCHIRCWISIWCGSTMATTIISAVLYQCVGARVKSHVWTQGQQILHTFPRACSEFGYVSRFSAHFKSLSVSLCVGAACFLCCVHICEYHLYWYCKNVVPSSTCALWGLMFSRFH